MVEISVANRIHTVKCGQNWQIEKLRMTLVNHNFPVRLGGDLSLDFTNTVEYRDSAHPIDTLQSFDHVIRWCCEVGVIDAAEQDHLSRLAAQHETDAAAAHTTTLALRETLYRIFTAVIAEEQPLNDDVARLNNTLDTALRHIAPSIDGYVWAWVPSNALVHIVTPIALAAAELLTSDQLQWVRQCPNCGWLFVDTSRNHSRRWCSMDFCGSKIKSRRQYERRKGVQAK